MKKNGIIWGTIVLATVTVLMVSLSQQAFSASGDDVGITSVSPSVTSANVGATVTITVVAHNFGPSTVSFTVFTKANQGIVDSSAVNLAAGRDKTLSVKWLTTSYDPGTYVVSANATLASDVNQSNNVFTDGTVRLLPSIVGVNSLPVDKLGLLAPYLAVAATILVTVSALVLYLNRRKNN